MNIIQKTKNIIKKNKILVTRGAGFIGSHIVDELIKLGQKVVVLDDLSSGFKENVNSDRKLFIVFSKID